MLRVTYTGGDSTQRWLFDPDDVDMDEAEAIEQAMGPGETWDTFLAGALDRKVRARKVLLWHLLRRTNPDYPLSFADLPNVKMGQLVVELGTDELAKLIAQIEDLPITKVRKDRHLAAMHEEYAKAQQAEAEIEAGDVSPDPDPKAGAAAGTNAEDGILRQADTAPRDPSVADD